MATAQLVVEKRMGDEDVSAVEEEEENKVQKRIRQIMACIKLIE